MSSHELPPLPRGWVWSRVGEVGEVRLGRQRSPKDHVGKHMRPYLRVANVFEARIDTSDVLQMNFTPEEFEIYQLKPGDILLNEGQSLEWVGRPAIYRGEVPGACFQNTLVRFRAYPCVLPEFALLVFRMYLHSQRFQRIARWTTNIAHLGAQRFAEVEFPVPPLAEQKRIVAETEKLLSDLDAGVSALKRVQVNLKRYSASVLKAAFEGRLVPTEAELARTQGSDYEPAGKLLERILEKRQSQPRGDQSPRNRASGRKSDSSSQLNLKPGTLPNLPDGWVWAQMSQLGDVVTGFTPPTERGEYFGGEIPFFKPTDLDAGYTLRHAREFLTEAGASVGRILPSMSVLVTCIGATIGKTGLARVRCATNQQINAIIPHDLLDARWIYWVCASPWGQEQIKSNASATTLPILNKSRFQELPIPLPPHAEQARIISELERIFSLMHELKEAASNGLRRSARLRQSILKKAFEGELVPQDPEDEPASVLLERIRQQRVSPPPVPLPPGQQALEFDRPKKARLPRRRSASS